MKQRDRCVRLLELGLISATARGGEESWTVKETGLPMKKEAGQT